MTHLSNPVPLLEHRGYFGSVEADLEEGLLHGTVAGLNDVVHYEARTLPELGDAFRDSVDAYLEVCAEDGHQPAKPYSGKFLVRIGAELHRRIAARAAAEGVSMNEVVKRALVREAGEPASATGQQAEG